MGSKIFLIYVRRICSRDPHKYDLGGLKRAALPMVRIFDMIPENMGMEGRGVICARSPKLAG